MQRKKAGKANIYLLKESLVNMDCLMGKSDVHKAMETQTFLVV